jgi:hypothetical protein
LWTVPQQWEKSVAMLGAGIHFDLKVYGSSADFFYSTCLGFKYGLASTTKIMAKTVGIEDELQHYLYIEGAGLVPALLF